jgi:hemoglobin
MKDIASREDIIFLLDSFYEKVKPDPLLGPVFAHVDWPAHMPSIYNFWCSIILGDQSYRDNPFDKHKNLPISRSHFDRWVELFTGTVDEHFAGDQADEIKSRAHSISGIFQHRLGLA